MYKKMQCIQNIAIPKATPDHVLACSSTNTTNLFSCETYVDVFDIGTIQILSILDDPPRVWFDASSPLPPHSFKTHADALVSNPGSPQSDGFLFHITLNHVQLNAIQSLCHLCTLVWARLVKNFSADDLGPDKITSALNDGVLASEISPQVRISVRQVKHSDSYVYLCIEAAVQEESQGIKDFLPVLTKFTANLESIGLSLNSSTSSAESFVVASRWLDDCRTKHVECVSHPDFAQVIPGRLIQVNGCSATESISLLVTDPKVKYEYLTLSHRWGESAPLRLTKTLFPEFLDGIAINRLAKTFRDAIMITRRLGFCYVWIDCLCILQDSPQDWATESAKMAGVYGNGVCNIAAAASLDSDGGCFRDRNPFEILPLQLQYQPRQEGHKSFQDLVFIFDDNVENTWEGVGGKLNDRGWILQETLLAPRTIYYDQKQLYWECRSLRACEIWPHGDQTHGRMWSDADVREKTVFDIRLLREEEEDSGWSESDPNLLYHRWETLVEGYSTKALTYGSDKLVAISGLAGMFASRLGDQYLAGLWKNDFLRGLTWRSVSYASATRLQESNRAEYRAPSWSWASIDGHIQYPLRKPEHFKAPAKLVHVAAIPHGDSQIGLVGEASLRIVGLMKTGTWLPAYSYQYGMHLQHPEHSKNDDHRDLLMRLYPDIQPDASEKIVHCLQLGRQSRGNSQRVFGLVLVPSGRQVSNEYRRVGSFQTPGSHFDEQVSVDEDWDAFDKGWTEREITIV